VTIVPVYLCLTDNRLGGLDVKAGLQWVLEDAANHPESRAVVQRSLGGGFLDEDEALLNANIPVVASQGNSGVDTCADRYDPLRTPAKMLVGAVNVNHQMAGFSSFGACNALLAPGVAVNAAYIGANDQVAAAQGTSMAAPHVAGAVAQLLSRNKKLTPTEIKQILINKATPNAIANVPAGTPNNLLSAGATLMVPDAAITGKTYATCQGTYRRSQDLLNGAHIWDRVTPSSSRFIFYCGGRWRITGSQWRAQFLDGRIRHCGAFMKSAPSDINTPWYEAKWSGNGVAAGQLAVMHGSTYATCQGTYAQSRDKLNGVEIWDRVTPSSSRFIFYCGGRWRITGSQWRAQFLDGRIRHCGAFMSSAPTGSDTPWHLADWTERNPLAHGDLF